MSARRCARCGRRIAVYLDVGGPYWAHVIPLSLHPAVAADEGAA